MSILRKNLCWVPTRQRQADELAVDKNSCGLLDTLKLPQRKRHPRVIRPDQDQFKRRGVSRFEIVDFQAPRFRQGVEPPANMVIVQAQKKFGSLSCSERHVLGSPKPVSLVRAVNGVDYEYRL